MSDAFPPATIAEATETAVRDFYDGVADEYAAALPGTAFEAPMDLGMLDQFVSLLQPGSEVLDAGCGAGRMIDALTDRGVGRVDGVDLSPRMVEIAARTHPGSHIVTGALDAMPVVGASYDGVLAWFSLIHTSPGGCAAVLAEFARVLRPRGLLLVGVQTGEGERIARGSSYGGSGEVGAFLHTTDRLGDDLVAAGFVIVATAQRSARPGERWGQGFLIAELDRSVQGRH